MVDTEENVKKYWAFISYSHADRAWADWLHRSLENYPMPRDLVGQPTPAHVPIPKRFVPVFRDREELPTATDLGAVIARALRHARFLVVICSPRSAKSPWVEKEIIEYKRTHGESRVLCLIVDGEPWASGGKPGFSSEDECFPQAVRFHLGQDGELSSEPTYQHVYLWSRPDHRLVAERSLADGAVNALAEHPSGNGWVAGTAKGRLHFIGLQDLKNQREPVITGETAIQGFCWNPEKSILAVGLAPSDPATGGGSLLQTTADGKELSRQTTENLSPEIFAWSADGAKVAAAGQSPYFYVTDAGDRGKTSREIKGKLCVTGVVFTPEGTLRTIDLATGMETWNVETGQVIGEPESLFPLPVRCAFSPAGSHFVGVRRGPAAYLHNSTDGSIRTEPLSNAFTVNRCVYLDKTHVLLMSEGGLAQVRCLRSEEPAAEFLPFDPGYPDISSLSDDGTLLAAACSSDSLVRIYDLRTSKQLGRPLRFPSNLHGLCFSGNGQFLTAICWDGKVRRVDWRNGLRFTVGAVEVVTPIDSGFDMLDELRFQPGGKLAALPTLDGIKIIDTTEGVVARTIPVQGGCNALAWSPDGKTIAAASRDQVLSFHPSDGSPGNSSIRISLAAPAIDLAWSPDARTLASLSSSNRVDCLSTETGLPVGIGFPTGSSGMRLSWVSHGKWLAVSDGDERSKLWDPETGMDVVRLPDAGSGQLAPLDVPQREAVLLTGEKGFYLVPVPVLTNAPDWLPSLLEGIGGGSHGSEDGRTMIDPDAWMTAEKIARAGTRDVLWSPVVDWLLDRAASRPAFPGALTTESEVTASIDLESTRVFDALVQRARVLLRSDDEIKQTEALALIEKALVIKPGHIQLLRTKQQIGQLTNRSALVREACAAIASSTDSPLIDVLDAKFIEAGSQLSDEPKNPARARKLLEEILSVDPSREDAQNLLKTTSP